MSVQMFDEPRRTDGGGVLRAAGVGGTGAILKVTID